MNWTDLNHATQLRQTLASPAMGHWGTCPNRLPQLILFCFTKYDGNLLCEIYLQNLRAAVITISSFFLFLLKKWKVRIKYFCITVYISYIICLRLKLFRCRSVPLLAPNPGDATDAKRQLVTSTIILTWKRPPGRPRSKWLDCIRYDNNLRSAAGLWRCAVRRGHSGVTQRSQLTAR